MHGPTFKGLEEYLSGSGESEQMRDCRQHLAECAECRRMVEELQNQAGLMRVLRAPEGTAPNPGFYGRVVNRIDAQRRGSPWSIFLEPAFARRLVFASLALFILMASAMWTSDPAMPLHEANPVGIMAVEMPHADGIDPHRDRDVVFVHLATYGGAGLPISSD
jgi:anti-sigma factor RsiW